MILTGDVIRYGDNVDTDVIIPARYLNTSSAKELAAHCMEDIDATFVASASRRATSSPPAPTSAAAPPGSTRRMAIKESGVGAVVAKSFARIFYRNAINIGLPIIECDADIAEGDKV